MSLSCGFEVRVYFIFSDTLLCMKSIAFPRHENTFVFLGDQRIHDLYVAFKNHFISAEESARNDKISEDHFTNLPNETFTNHNLRLTLNFTWTPYISQVMEETLREFVVSYYILNSNFQDS